MEELDPRRLMLFIVVSLVLVGSALAFSRGGGEGPPPSSEATAGVSEDAEAPEWAERAKERVQSLAAELEEQAERFLLAFGRYEVGEVSRDVKFDIRETSTPAFARELLGAPPAPPPLGGFVGTARVAAMHVNFLSASGLRALVSGDLKRGVTPEEFGFLFVYREGVWLASGPGQ